MLKFANPLPPVEEDDVGEGSPPVKPPINW